MKRHEARRIAEHITNDQLQQMLDSAKAGVKDWTKVSAVNKSLTKGAAWNVLAKDFDVNHSYNILAKTNMVREFGEFLPDELKPTRSSKPNRVPIHQEPIFNQIK